MWEHSWNYLLVLLLCVLGGHLKHCIHTHSGIVCLDRKTLPILSHSLPLIHIVSKEF